MKKLTLVAASLAAVISGQAFALGVGVNPEATVVLSGASAQDQGLRALIEGLCSPGTLDMYSENGVNPAGYNAYFCSIPVGSLGATAAAKDQVLNGGDGNGMLDTLIYKRSAGGSGQGPIGLCDGPIDRLVLDGNCRDDGVAPDPVAGDRIFGCGVANVMPDDSHGGLSDLEFDKLPLGGGGDACDQPGIVLSDNPIWGTIFNTPVSLNLRDALQCVQGLEVGEEDEANMPSLPKSVVASIFAGAIPNWDRLRAPRFDGTLVPLDDAVNDLIANGACPGYDAATYPVPADTRVRACRRVSSSGTNTQFRVKFMNAPCNAAAHDQAIDNTPNSNATTNAFSNWQNTNPPIASLPAIIETSGSSDMHDCIQAFSDPTNTATQRWAIGIQSTENNVDLAAEYRFIKIDHSAPTVVDVLRNEYFDWAEAVWSWRTDDLTPERAVANDIQATLVAGTGAEASIRDLINANFLHSFGASGLVSLNTTVGNAPSLPILNGVGEVLDPTATSTHAFGGTLNHCRTPFVNQPFAFGGAE